MLLVFFVGIVSRQLLLHCSTYGHPALVRGEYLLTFLMTLNNYIYFNTECSEG